MSDIVYGVEKRSVFDDSAIELEDEFFSTEEEAEDFRRECSEGFTAGAEVLEYANRAFENPDDFYFEVVKIKK